MTPTKKGRATHIKIERKRRQLNSEEVAHVAGGEHKGIVINKQTSDDGQFTSLTFISEQN